MSITVPWTFMNSLLTNEQATASYADANGNYYIFAQLNGVEYLSVLDKQSANAQAFESNHKNNSTSIL